MMETAENRLMEVLTRADDAFFEVVADAFPEITTGDVGPDWVQERENHNRVDVTAWIEGNAPRPPAGAKVRAKQAIDRYPFFQINEGELGTVLELNDTWNVYVQMERYLGDGLEPEWRNSVIYHGIQIVDFWHDFEILEEPEPEWRNWLGEIVVFDDNIACPTRGEVIDGPNEKGEWLVAVTRRLNPDMAARDNTFLDENIWLDLDRRDIKQMTDHEFNHAVNEYWAEERKFLKDEVTD